MIEYTGLIFPEYAWLEKRSALFALVSSWLTFYSGFVSPLAEENARAAIRTRAGLFRPSG